MRSPTWFFALALGCLTAPAAMAADACGPLKQVNAIDITLSPSKSRVYAPVSINGVQKTFLLDTGGFATQIAPSVAKELKLPVTESGGKILDLYGHASGSEAMVASFGLGHLLARDTSILISTFDTSEPNAAVTGILAPDFMGSYDTELDFAGGRMNYFSTDHCDGHVIYWQAAAVAVVPMTFGDDHHIVIPVTLDGHQFKATIDTGAMDTLISAPDAKRVYGLDAPGSDDTPMPDIDGKKRFEHVFSKLEFDGITIGNPRVTVFPQLVGKRDPNNDFQTGTRVARVDDIDNDPPVTIGMNVLSKLRLYIAFKERKLYITPASSPAPATK